MISEGVKFSFAHRECQYVVRLSLGVSACSQSCLLSFPFYAIPIQGRSQQVYSGQENIAMCAKENFKILHLQRPFLVAFLAEKYRRIDMNYDSRGDTYVASSARQKCPVFALLASYNVTEHARVEEEGEAWFSRLL